MVKPTWRLLCEIEGETSELVSIRERTNGDLIIVRSRGEMFGTVEDAPHPVRQQKYSVHVSPNHPGNLIKQSTEGDDRWTAAALVLPGPDGLIWPIVMSRAADLRIPVYRKSAREGERFDMFPSFDPDRNSPVVCIVVTDKDAVVNVGQMLEYRVEFTHFNIIVYGYFMPVRSVGAAHDQVFVTSAQTKNDDEPEWRTEGGLIAPSAPQLFQMMFKTNSTLSKNYMIHYRQLCEKSGFDLTDEAAATIEAASALINTEPH